MSASRHYKRFPNKEQRRMLRKDYCRDHGRHDRGGAYFCGYIKISAMDAGTNCGTKIVS